MSQAIKDMYSITSFYLILRYIGQSFLTISVNMEIEEPDVE